MDCKLLIGNKYDLHYLSYHGQIEEITKLDLIEKYINVKDIKGCTPLHLACAQNYTRVAEFLISSGANVNCQDENLSTPLHWVVYNNNMKLLKILLENQVHFNVQDLNGIQPIHLAALKCHVEIINILKQGETCGPIIDKLGITPIHLASHCGHNDVIKALLDTENFDVNSTDNNGVQPLHLATASNHIHTVQLLLEKGAVLSIDDSYNRYPMHWAAANGNVEMIKELNYASDSLKQNCLDKFMCTPLLLATIYGHDEAVSLLLQNNYTLNLESGQREMYLILTNLEGPDGVINKYYDILVSLPGTIHWAVAFCSKDVINRLLNDSIYIEDQVINVTTLLHMTSSFGNQDVVELLIDRGAQLNAPDKNGNTPLHWSIAHCHIETIQILLDRGANKNNALCWAASSGNEDIVKLLITYGCDVNEEDGDCEYSRTPLMWAATFGHTKIIKFLLNNGSEITNSDILHWCVFNGLVDIVKMLIERGLDVNESDLCFKRTALHWAAIVGNVSMTKYLLSVDGIKLNGNDKDDLPIHFAIDGNHHEIIKMLIEHGADFNCIGKLGMPLLMAIEAGNLKTVEILVESGANLVSCYYDPETMGFYGLPLRLAVQCNYTNIIHYLLQQDDIEEEKDTFIHYLARYRNTTDLLKYMKPEDVNHSNFEEQTPLFYAILGNVNNVIFLIENGANVNHKDEDGRTPLYVAIENGKLECVQILIDNGADVTTCTYRHGLTPLMLAIQNANFDIIKLLIDYYNVDFNTFDDNLWSPLHHAAYISNNDENKMKIIQYLLSKNVEINISNNRGRTPLHLALISAIDSIGSFFNYGDEFSLDIIKIFLDNGANINVKTCEGCTPLSIAVREKEDKFIKLLILHGADVNLNTNIVTYCTNEKDIPILQLLLCCGLRFHHILQCNRDKFECTVQSFIEYAEINPLSLKQLCRITCLNVFGKNYSEIVKSQFLPYVLKQYLLFDDL